MTLPIQIIEIITQEKEKGITRVKLQKQLLNSDKTEIDKIIYKLSRKQFIYYNNRKWFLDNKAFDLISSDIWRLTQIPFEKSNYFYFYRKDWQEKVSQKKVYS